MMIRACPAYDTAGYGTALGGTSSYYDIVLYVDSKDSNTTASQAGCMVEKLSSDPNLANRLTGGLLDAAEISIELSPGGSGEAHRRRRHGVGLAHFVRFSDAAQRQWLSQRSTVFLRTAPELGGFSASKEESGGRTAGTGAIDIQSGGTQFPDSYLRMWPNDIHFAAVVAFPDWESLVKFDRYVAANPWAAGNHFLSGVRSSAVVLETNSIVFEARTFPSKAVPS